MDHVFYSDGNVKKISWIIQTNDSIIEQSREHAQIYKNKISELQSKYVALHIGLFWGIGVFILKNNDIIKIKLDEKTMFDQINTDLKIEDEFIVNRIKFIKQLTIQRKLKIKFELIQQKDNLANKILEAKELKTKNE
ncbi:hypothetical protein C5F49_06250 [Nitrosopumilus oxyclinae]|uniref:Uncharacterized protein n=1 Tax=Nitrosopumilus oxyclinae TaxID=1959104 RepID=A0A7D5RBL3_9ARCH|nr:hypothetical protein [Nitrosopumilus oxyclinae]QLH04963.1 hypothetical protein C5F49_06250 [Nitrosopumilus oxyclinae]